MTPTYCLTPLPSLGLCFLISNLMEGGLGELQECFRLQNSSSWRLYSRFWFSLPRFQENADPKSLSHLWAFGPIVLLPALASLPVKELSSTVQLRTISHLS